MLILGHDMRLLTITIHELFNGYVIVLLFTVLSLRSF